MGQKKRKKTPPGKKGHLKREIYGIILVSIALLNGIGIFLWHYQDQTILQTEIGAVGVLSLRFLYFFFGAGVYVLPLLFLIGSYLLFQKDPAKRNSARIWGLVCFFLAILVFAANHLHLNIPLQGWLAQGALGAGGGVLGNLIAYFANLALGSLGTYLLSFFMLVAGAMLFFQKPLSHFWMSFWHINQKGAKAAQKAGANFKKVKKSKNSATKKSLASSKKSESQSQPILKPELPVVEMNKADYKITAPKTEDHDQEKKKEANISGGEESGSFYKLPLPDLLPPLPLIEEADFKQEVQQKVTVLTSALMSFGVQAQVKQVTCGPSLIRYELQPASGVKVQKFTRLADDIALSLAVSHVRVEAPIPGKSLIGIEVPREKVTPVYFREMMESEIFRNAVSKLSVALGKDIGGGTMVAGLEKMPHLLIAGATGSGKSVFLNTLICSILYKARPDEVKFLMIDPKKVELANYRGLPHLVSPVITDVRKANVSLKWVVTEMETRYGLFADDGVKDLSGFNQSRAEREKLPQIVVIIDELADLMMVCPGEVEDSICRLAQMARAAGIYLVIATQRPSVDVITGLIKANIPSRISFAVSSQTDSRTILDMGGAEKLLGNGDMLYSPVGINKPLRVQGAFLKEAEIKSLVNFYKQQGDPEYMKSLTKFKETETESKNDQDELLEEVLKTVVDNQQVSASFLQRKFRIGYNRAARLVDELVKIGAVGEATSGKQRHVLWSQSDLQKYQEQK